MKALLGAFAVAAALGAMPAEAGPVAEPTEVALAIPEALPEPEAKPSSVVARVDLSRQRMTVYVDDVLVHTFPVSTGRGRYGTPTGRWNAAWLSPKHRSRKYNNAPMPWSVFFHDGYAVHGTTEVRSLGRPASHGCIRLHPDNAKIFYTLVKDIGLPNTLIAVVK
jgi:lipoprotein-anchoring transpeptidase ErfK/SrfK